MQLSGYNYYFNNHNNSASVWDSIDFAYDFSRPAGDSLKILS